MCTKPPITKPVFTEDFEGDWFNELRSQFQSVTFQYSCSDPSKNYYEVCSDPLDPDNKVLHFKINDCCDYSGRVQMTFVPEDKEIYHFSMDYMFSPDIINSMKTASWFWFSMIEFWDYVGFDTGDPAGQARYSLSIEKTNGDIYFLANGEIRQPESRNGERLFYKKKIHDIPEGFFNIDFYIEREDPGKYIVKLNGEILFDIDAPTIYPGNYKPFHYFEPCKFYSNKEFLLPIINSGGNCSVYFDNFKIFKQ